MSKPNEYDTYIIPPNFIEGGTFFGGLLKLRNTAEALVIVLAIRCFSVPQGWVSYYRRILISFRAFQDYPQGIR